MSLYVQCRGMLHIPGRIDTGAQGHLQHALSLTMVSMVIFHALLRKVTEMLLIAAAMFLI